MARPPLSSLATRLLLLVALSSVPLSSAPMARAEDAEIHGRGEAAATAERDARYFRIWSVHANAPQHEISPDALQGRSLGYWELRFDGVGATTAATFHSSAGIPQVTFRYVEVDGRVYADFFAGDGASDALRLGRKATMLANRMPHWEEPGASP